MKKQIFILLIFTISFSCATNFSIDEQIEIIKKAPESKRVELMNQFKRQLVLMNQEERTNAIAQLKSDKKSTSLPSSFNNNIIERVQSSNIEQNIQMSRDIVIREEIQESIQIPNIPNSPTPLQEQPLDIPSMQTSPIIEEPQQEIPNNQSQLVTESQEMPNIQTIEPTVEQSQEMPTTTTPPPTTPSTGESQGIPNTPTPNGGI